MNWKELLKFAVTGLICATIALCVYHFFIAPDKVPIVTSEDIKTGSSVEKIAASSGVKLSSGQAAEVADKIKKAKPAESVNTTAGDLKDTAKQMQQQSGSDFAPVVTDEDLSKIDKDTPVELQQYHIYAAPKVLREVGLKAGTDGNAVDGISYGIKRRISTEGKYIGVRADYDWKEKEAAVWLTYTY